MKLTVKVLGSYLNYFITLTNLEAACSSDMLVTAHLRMIPTPQNSVKFRDTAVLPKIHVFWDVVLYLLVCSYWSFGVS